MNIPHYLEIADSEIHGRGLFTARTLQSGLILGTARVSMVRENQTLTVVMNRVLAESSIIDFYVPTPLGGLLNHSNTPNCAVEFCSYDKGSLFQHIKTTKQISEGEELTLKYQLYDPNGEAENNLIGLQCSHAYGNV